MVSLTRFWPLSDAVHQDSVAVAAILAGTPTTPRARDRLSSNYIIYGIRAGIQMHALTLEYLRLAAKVVGEPRPQGCGWGREDSCGIPCIEGKYVDHGDTPRN